MLKHTQHIFNHTFTLISYGSCPPAWSLPCAHQHNSDSPCKPCPTHAYKVLHIGWASVLCNIILTAFCAGLSTATDQELSCSVLVELSFRPITNESRSDVGPVRTWEVEVQFTFIQEKFSSYWTHAVEQISGHQQTSASGNIMHWISSTKLLEFHTVLFCHPHWLWSNLYTTEPQSGDWNLVYKTPCSFRQTFTSHVQASQRSPCAVNQLPPQSSHPEVAAQLWLSTTCADTCLKGTDMWGPNLPSQTPVGVSQPLASTGLL